MAELPYMNSHGLIPKIFEKIIDAKTPPKYTQEFQKTVVGYGSGGALAFIPLLKKLEFLTSDGTPTQAYNDFRGEAPGSFAMAQAIKKAFTSLYNHSEYAEKLDDKKLKEAIIKITGYENTNQAIGYIMSTFKNLCALADFDKDAETENQITKEVAQPKSETKFEQTSFLSEHEKSSAEFKIGYTFNLNLPETKDIEVFNAIFKSLKENLLK